jgi:hypothetical protein
VTTGDSAGQAILIVPFSCITRRSTNVCSFWKCCIKEHGVNLLFEEWKQEGHPLQRVWIRIFRLPQKLGEFLVLWSLGYMLGPTQAVAMISSLRKEYSHAEVVVLNMDLLPTCIDIVVIGDRL